MSVEAGRKDPEGDRLLLLEWNNIEDINCSLVGFFGDKTFFACSQYLHCIIDSQKFLSNLNTFNGINLRIH